MKSEHIDQINYSPSFSPNEPYNMKYESKAVENLKINSYDAREGLDLYDFFDNSISLFQYSANTCSNVISECRLYSESLRTIAKNIGEGGMMQRSLNLDNISISDKTTNESSIIATNFANEIDLFLNEYIRVMFGREDISTDVAKELDLEMLLTVKELEGDGESDRVNYFSLYIETIINQTINGTLRDVNEKLFSDLNIRDVYDESSKDVLDCSPTVQYFNKTADMLKYYLEKNSTFVNDAILSLNNVFIALERYEEFLEDELTSNNLLKNYEVFNKIDRDACVLISENVSNFIKVFDSYKQNKELILTNLSEMHEIRKYYYN